LSLSTVDVLARESTGLLVSSMSRGKIPNLLTLSSIVQGGGNFVRLRVADIHAKVGSISRHGRSGRETKSVSPSGHPVEAVSAAGAALVFFSERIDPAYSTCPRNRKQRAREHDSVAPLPCAHLRGRSVGAKNGMIACAGRGRLWKSPCPWRDFLGRSVSQASQFDRELERRPTRTRYPGETRVSRFVEGDENGAEGLGRAGQVDEICAVECGRQQAAKKPTGIAGTTTRSH